MNKYGPLITAAVTPFDSFGQLDMGLFERLLEHLLGQRSTAIVVTGTTGEAPTLNSIERLKIWESAVDYVDGRVPIIAGVGTNNTQTTVHNAILAEEAEVDALMVVVPYYNKPSQKGLLKHFKAVADAVKLPIILYNIPARCGTSLEIETILELAKIDNIVGIKDATGSMELMTKLKCLLPEFLIYSGDDSFYLDNLKIGGQGVISVASHVVGKKMHKIYDLYTCGWVKEAEELNTRLKPVYTEIFTYPNPAPIKTLLNYLGIDVGGVRLPLVALDAEEREQFLRHILPYVDSELVEENPIVVDFNI